MIDPHLSASLFCTQVANKKEHEYIIVHTPSGLTGKTQTKKLASHLPEITEFVKSILKEKSHLAPTDLKDLKNTFSKIVKEQTPWYHKILAFFSKSYRDQRAEVDNVLTNLSKALVSADTHPTQSATALICHHVKQHLAPYLSGKITKETDKKDRPPLIAQLEPMIRKEFPLTSMDARRIEQIAFDEYLKEALQGYTKQIGRPMHPEAPEWQEHRAVFVEALVPAIKIDFTPDFIQSQKLSERLHEALWVEFRRASTEE